MLLLFVFPTARPTAISHGVIHSYILATDLLGIIRAPIMLTQLVVVLVYVVITTR